MNIKVILYGIIFVIYLPTILLAQKSIISYDLKGKNKKIELKTEDSLAIYTLIKKELKQLHEKGYFTAHLGSKIDHQKYQEYRIESGNRYVVNEFNVVNLSDLGLERFLNQYQIAENTFDLRQLNELIEKLLDYSENNGYPFAKAYFDSLGISGLNMNLAFVFDAGPLIKFDTVQINGDVKLRKKFVHAYLGLKPGFPYDHSKLEQSNDLLTKLSFVKSRSKVHPKFEQGLVNPQLFLDKRKADQFDAIVGFLPNQARNNELLITGRVLLSLNNLFSSAKQFYGLWKKNEEQSQELSLMYKHPNLFLTPIGIEGTFNLLKQDTTFITRNIGLYIFVPAGGKTSFGLKTLWYNSSGIGASIEENLIKNINTSFYGYEIEFLNVDDVQIPKRGLLLHQDSYFGIRQKQDVSDKANQFKLNWDVEWYVPISRQFNGLLSYKGGALISDSVEVNELYRLGGAYSLRGFNENQFFANNYQILTGELRVFLEQKSFVYAFLDYGLINLGDQLKTDNLLGFGVGMKLATKSGFINFAYALGQSQNQQLNVSNSKIHIGFEGIF